jgi:RNase P/RNase MRP subunit p29
MGQPVILRVAAGEMRVPLRGKLIGETQQTLRLRIADCLDLHIMKSAVLAVEEDTRVPVAVQPGGSRPSAAMAEN